MGTYILIIKVDRSIKNLKVGSLGKLNFQKGYYCYVGSAMGRVTSLENRIGRHLSKKKKLRWHIDYLLARKEAKVESVIVIPSKKRLEHLVSESIERKADKTIEGFGSSDCRCKGNLHYFKRKKLLSKVLV